MTLLSLFASTFLVLASTAPNKEAIRFADDRLPPVLASTFLPAQEVQALVILVHVDTSQTLLPTASLSMNGRGELVIEDSGITLEATYRDSRNIEHRVITNCRNYTSQQACLNAHARALELMQTLFKPVS